MTSPSLPPTNKQLAQLYSQARYFVRIGQQRLQLQVGQPSPDLDQQLSAACYLYITAWNPHSHPIGDQQNAAADHALQHRLVNANLTFHPASSSDAYGDELEHGWLVLDIAQGQADELARTFGQAGILYWEAGQPVRLRMQFARLQHGADDAHIQWID